MSKDDSNEKIRSKTEQAIDRLLRTKDVIPGASKGNSEKNSLSAGNMSAKPTNAEQQTIDIPRFDLAEKILAEQRKNTSIKRKAPGRKFEAPRHECELESIWFAIGQSEPAVFEQDQIIIEIVARDIEKLCSGKLRI